MKNIVNLPKNNKDNVTAYYLGKKQRYNPSDRSVSYELQFATERELSEDEMKTLEYFAIDNFAGIFEHSTYVKVFVTEDYPVYPNPSYIEITNNNDGTYTVDIVED